MSLSLSLPLCGTNESNGQETNPYDDRKSSLPSLFHFVQVEVEGQHTRWLEIITLPHDEGVKAILLVLDY